MATFAFALARFVAGHHGRTYARRNFGVAAYRRRALSLHRHSRDGLRRRLRHRGNSWLPRRHFGPGGRRRLRGNRWAPRRHHSGNRWAQRRNYPGAPGPSTRAAVPRETAAAPKTAAVPDAVADQMVDALNENEASASNFSADADELVPLPPEFAVPPMEWLLGGPSAGWLIDDPEFDDEPVRDSGSAELAAAAHLPPVYYCLRHGFEPCFPSPALLGLTNRLGELRLDDPSEGTGRP